VAALAAAMMERKDKADEKNFIVWLGVVQLFWGLVLNFEDLSSLSSLNTIPSSTLLEKKGCKEPLGEEKYIEKSGASQPRSTRWPNRHGFSTSIIKNQCGAFACFSTFLCAALNRTQLKPSCRVLCIRSIPKWTHEGFPIRRMCWRSLQALEPS